MLITEYTTYSSVRTVLGLTERQLKDEVLADEVYSFSLVADLRSVGESVLAGSDIIQDYQELIDGTEALTPQASTFMGALRAFSAYSVANQTLPALAEISPYFLSDSKASYRKHQQDTAKRINESFLRFRSLLQEAYAGYLGVAAPESPRISLLGVSSPSFDPVTGG